MNAHLLQACVAVIKLSGYVLTACLLAAALASASRFAVKRYARRRIASACPMRGTK